MGTYQSQHTGAEHDAYVTKQALVNLIYPVGAIYMSVNATSPATLFGGTWAAIEGKFLVGADNTFTAGDTGGNVNHTHTTVATTTGSHTLVESEIPSHSHTFTGNAVAAHTHTFNRHSGTDDSNFSGHVANAVASNDTTPAQDAVTTSSAGGHTPSGTISSYGGGRTYPQPSFYNNKRSIKSPALSQCLYLEAYRIKSASIKEVA